MYTSTPVNRLSCVKLKKFLFKDILLIDAHHKTWAHETKNISDVRFWENVFFVIGEN